MSKLAEILGKLTKPTEDKPQQEETPSIIDLVVATRDDAVISASFWSNLHNIVESIASFITGALSIIRYANEEDIAPDRDPQLVKVVTYVMSKLEQTVADDELMRKLWESYNETLQGLEPILAKHVGEKVYEVYKQNNRYPHLVAFVLAYTKERLALEGEQKMSSWIAEAISNESSGKA